MCHFAVYSIAQNFMLYNNQTLSRILITVFVSAFQPALYPDADRQPWS
jgi:hypothetical protein